MRLSPVDFAALEGVILDFYRHLNVRMFRRAAIRGVLRLIPARRILFVDSPLSCLARSFRAVSAWESSASGVRDLLTSPARRGPLAGRPVPSGRPVADRARRLIELADADPESFDELFSPAFGPRLLRVAWLCGSTRVAMHMSRGPLQPGFTRRDGRVLELLLPHFVLGLRNAERVRDREERPRAHADLTPREAQIAPLLALGRTNREIATVLHAGIRTVEKHVEHILLKLGAPNRTAAAAMFAELENA